MIWARHFQILGWAKIRYLLACHLPLLFTPFKRSRGNADFEQTGFKKPTYCFTTDEHAESPDGGTAEESGEPAGRQELHLEWYIE
jgi:hypothetical protein